MVSKVNMAVDLGGIKMKNPINTASGTYGFGWQFEGFYDVSRLGSHHDEGLRRRALARAIPRRAWPRSRAA